MAYILNRNQQVYYPAIYPISAYSRVVSLSQLLPDDGNWYVAVSRNLAQNFWLIGIDVWASPTVANDTNASYIVFRAGQGVSWTYAEVRTWEEILPIHAGAHTYTNWAIYDGVRHMRWNIKKRFQGEQRKLAITSMRALGMGIGRLEVSFEITEG